MQSAPIARDSLAQRALAFVQGTRVTDTGEFRNLLKIGLGGIDAGDVRAELIEPLAAASRLRDELEEMRTTLAGETDPGRRRELLARADEKIRQLEDASASVAKIQRDLGEFGGGNLQTDGGRPLAETGRALADSLSDVAAVISPTATARGSTRVDGRTLAEHARQHPGVPIEEVRAALDMEARATRAGLTNEAVSRRADALQAGGRTGAFPRMTAIQELLDEQADDAFKSPEAMAARVARARQVMEAEPGLDLASRDFDEQAMSAAGLLATDKQARRRLGAGAIAMAAQAFVAFNLQRGFMISPVGVQRV